MLTYLSLFDGIGAACVAWEPLGWECVGVSEIEPFSVAVTSHHRPHVPHLGDVTKITEEQVAALGRIDLIVGGFPCQDLSVAGKRAGLRNWDGSITRSGLFFDAMRIVRWAREHCGLRWALIENVPGLYSSNRGRDFAAVVGEMVGAEFDVPDGGWRNAGFAVGPGGLFEWATLDAQFFNLAQRRVRVFALGDFGDWSSRPPILLEPESLRGHPAPRREAGDELAKRLTRGAAQRFDAETETMIPVAHSLRGEGFDASEDGTGRGTPLVPVHPYTLAIRGRGDSSELEYRQDGTANALLTPNGGRAGIGVGAIAFYCKDHGADAGEVAPTLRSMGHDGSHANGGGQAAVAFMADDYKDGGYEECDTARPLTTSADRTRAAPIVAGSPECAFRGDTHASTQETDASALLRGVRQAIGAQAFAQWGLGVLDSLQRPEILRQALHGGELRPATFSRSWVVGCALGSPLPRAEGAMQSLREAVGEGRASQGWQPPEQLADKLGAYLSGLSQPGAQAERLMRDLWAADEGAGVLRQALSAVQEVGRSFGSETQSAHRTYAVRRLTVEECEFLQGFPRGYTLVPHRNKPAADGPRYKALGNSMAVPCMAWLGRRINAVEAMTAHDSTWVAIKDAPEKEQTCFTYCSGSRSLSRSACSSGR